MPLYAYRSSQWGELEMAKVFAYFRFRKRLANPLLFELSRLLLSNSLPSHSPFASKKAAHFPLLFSASLLTLLVRWFGGRRIEMREVEVAFAQK